MSTTRVRRRRAAAPTVAAAFVVASLIAGCGSRIDDSRLEAAQLSGGVGVDGSAGQGGTGEGGGVALPGTDTALGPDGATAADAVAPESGSIGGEAGAPGAPAAGPKTAGAPAAGGAGGADAPPAGGAAVAAGARCAKPLSTIVLGQTLAASGLIGASTAQMRDGLAVWAKDVNARGGVECHPVKLIQLDDGSDPGRVSSNFETLVKDRGAVALVGAGVPVATASLRSAAERLKVPVVGGDLITPDWNQSPFLFSQGGAGDAAYRGGTIQAVKGTPGAKTAGLIYCVEASVCTNIKNSFAQGAQQAGAAVGPQKSTSLTQSDYTAECQTLKDGKAEVAFIAVDGSAATRIARNCAAQGYRPAYVSAGITISADVSQDPNLRKNKVYLGATVAPFTESDTPGGQAFQTAMKKYGIKTLAQSHIQGWSSGKLFEAALARVSAKARAGDVTTALVLEGLWQVKGETLGGLAPGVSFSKGAPSATVNCYYLLRLGEDGFTAPLKSAKQCIR